MYMDHASREAKEPSLRGQPNYLGLPDSEPPEQTPQQQAIALLKKMTDDNKDEWPGLRDRTSELLEGEQQRAGECALTPPSVVPYGAAPFGSGPFCQKAEASGPTFDVVEVESRCGDAKDAGDVFEVLARSAEPVVGELGQDDILRRRRF